MKRAAHLRSGLLIVLLAGATVSAAQDLAPRAPVVDFTGLSMYDRPVDKSYPVSDGAAVSISNRFGPVTVVTWDNPLVRLVGRIRVGADNAARAEEFGQAIELVGDHAGNRVEIRTEFPSDVPPGIGGYAVSLEVTVPRGAAVTIDNQYGDTSVDGVDGAVTVRSRFGAIALERINGPVALQARGEFPVKARQLNGGGTFTLRGSLADFGALNGAFTVNAYLGEISIRSPGSRLDLDVMTESGSVDLHLPADLAPDIDASAAFGAIESEWALEREAWGQVVMARQTVPESAHRFRIHTTYGDIRLHRDAVQPAVEPLVPEGVGQLITQSERESYLVPTGTVIEIAGTLGNVRVEGTDKNELVVLARKTARITDAGQAQQVMEALTLRLDASGVAYTVETTALNGIESLGCSEYRIDLEIRYPKSSPLRMTLQGGETTLTAPGPDTAVEQYAGVLRVRDAADNLRLVNRSGDIAITTASGTVTAEAHEGTVTARGVRGALTIEAESGRAIVENPGGPLNVRTTAGDVRVIALDGVRGEFDISARQGNVSVAVPDTADAFFIASTRGGSIFSKHELHGSVRRDMQSFQGRLNQGTHRVLLEALDGNIAID